ncbi:hydrogenase expression/formation protein [Legionella wadsworthii]|uniref:Hydrogenase expression/formation protein n=1 Tax=Legionella wadsworthii TaxID=28088 RepID=A0A378M0S2_9GAMM|nr:hydrogenase maturation protease [Legionella wadsworthii]STY29921.1 hydrogenase expression/formation protein [Legionella wadsworthii]
MIIKVLGIGSPFGDDQAGWMVIERLKQLLSFYPEIMPYLILESHDRPGVRLIELLEGFDTVFIIDAVKSGSPVGTIHQFQKEDVLEPKKQFSTHGMSVPHALQLACVLGELPKNVIFYGIEIDGITINQKISDWVEESISALSYQIQKEIIRIYERN